MFALALLLLSGMQAAPATTPAPPTASSTAGAPSTDQMVAQAGLIGGLLFTLDRAAWVSSDALMASVPKDQMQAGGGYVVEAVDQRTLRATYYRGEGEAARAFFVADVQAGKVVSRQRLAELVALTPHQLLLARARAIAADYARQNSLAPCTASPFNTVLMPSRNNGPIAVYLLSAQVDNASYPVGGHYRVVVSPEGKVLSSRAYSKSCINMGLPKRSSGKAPAGLVVSHLLDPVPTEMHVFASFSLQLPLYVITPDKRLWKVKGRDITVVPQ